MKILVFISLIYFTFCSSSCIQSQNTHYEDEEVKMIKRFYTEFCNVWNNTPSSVPANLLNEKIDSLAQGYCTLQIRNKAKEWAEYGQDKYTNDYGIVSESLKKLMITKDSTKVNSYIVYYTTTNSDASGRPVKQEVILHISVIKENDSYKIDDVK